MDPDIETASRRAVERLQAERLAGRVAWAYERSGFYRSNLDEAGIRPTDIQSRDDVRRLPMTTKEDVREDRAAGPELWGTMLATPFSEALRLHLTSGSTGRPVMIMHTEEDWTHFIHYYARALYAIGVRSEDAAIMTFNFGPWIGFWAAFHAAESLGCLMFPSGGQSTEQRIDMLRTYPITVLGCMPSYALHLAGEATAKGFDLSRDTSIRLTVHTGEPGAGIPSVRSRLEAAFGSRAGDVVGMTEMGLFGFTCDAGSNQLHISEDNVLAEVLDVETGDPVGPGEHGELILTNLVHDAMPILRYRTLDVVEIASEPCACGRTMLALQGGIRGRLDEMKKIRGVIVYPTQIEEVVRTLPEVGEHQVVIDRKGGLDELTVRCELAESAANDTAGQLAKLLILGLGIRVGVEPVERGAIATSGEKARRLIDLREGIPF